MVFKNVLMDLGLDFIFQLKLALQSVQVKVKDEGSHDQHEN